MSKRLLVFLSIFLLIVQHSNVLFFNKATVLNLFVHQYSKPNEVAWFVTNISWRITSLFGIFVAWKFIKWEETLEKTILTFFLLDCIKELIELIVWNNQYDNNWGIYWNTFFIIVIFFSMNKSFSKSIELIPEVEIESDGVYIVPKKARRFATFISSIFGYGIGSVDYYIRYQGNYYFFFFKRLEGFKGGRIPSLQKNRYLKLNNIEPQKFALIANEKTDKNWRFITNNCVTIFKKELGIKYWKLEFIPSIFVSNILKRA